MSAKVCVAPVRQAESESSRLRAMRYRKLLLRRHVSSWAHADREAKMVAEMALIIESRLERGVGRRDAMREQLPRVLDSELERDVHRRIGMQPVANAIDLGA